MDNGLVILAARPSAAESGSYDLARCLTGTVSGGALTVTECGTSSGQRWSF